MFLSFITKSVFFILLSFIEDKSAYTYGKNNSFLTKDYLYGNIISIYLAIFAAENNNKL